ncbi:hypothetical protein ACHWQZ_G007354 [Mnemiopsis leidyi]
MYETSSENYLSSDSEYSNDGDDSESSTVPNCVSNYSSLIQGIPPAISRELSKIMEIDVKMRKNFQEIDHIKSIMKSSLHSKPELREDLQQAKRKLHRILVLEEMKSQNIQLIASLLENSISKLEEEHSHSVTLKSLEMDAPSPICSHDDPPDDSNQDDPDEEEYDSTSNKKPGKRSSTASRGRGRKSMPRDTKEDDLDVILNNSRGSFGAKRKTRKRRDRKSSPSLLDIDPQVSDEPRYCSCNEISYGEMVGCDNNDCPIEWFHFRCVNLTAKPKGKWFCPKCAQDKKRNP